MITESNTFAPTAAHRATALQIWNDLEAWHAQFSMSDFDFYAVWGLCNAVLNTKHRDEATYARWVAQAEALWTEVMAKYSK